MNRCDPPSVPRLVLNTYLHDHEGRANLSAVLLRELRAQGQIAPAFLDDVEARLARPDVNMQFLNAFSIICMLMIPSYRDHVTQEDMEHWQFVEPFFEDLSKNVNELLSLSKAPPFPLAPAAVTTVGDFVAAATFAPRVRRDPCGLFADFRARQGTF